LTLKTRKSDKHHKKTAIIFKKCFIFDRIKIINTPKKRCHFHKNHLLFGRKRTSINLSLKNREKIVEGFWIKKPIGNGGFSNLNHLLITRVQSEVGKSLWIPPMKLSILFVSC